MDFDVTRGRARGRQENTDVTKVLRVAVRSCWSYCRTSVHVGSRMYGSACVGLLWDDHAKGPCEPAFQDAGNQHKYGLRRDQIAEEHLIRRVVVRSRGIIRQDGKLTTMKLPRKH